MQRTQLLKVVAGYAIVSTLYIAFSDTLVHLLAPNEQVAYRISVLKGFGFVALTALVLYTLLRRIRANEEIRYNALFNNHHAVMLLIDPDDGAVVDANPAAEKFYGWTRDRLRSMRISDINTLSPEEIRAEMARASSGGSGAFHFRHRLASGQIRDVEVHSGPVEFAGRKLLFSIVEDQTALGESEARYRKMFRANPHPMWVYDQQTLRFLAVNDAAIAHYGYGEDEFLGMTIADIRSPDEAARLREHVSVLKEGSVDRTGIWRHRRKDGTTIDVEVTAHGLTFDGRPARLILAHDITGRVRAERERHAADQKFRALVEQSLVGVTMADRRRVVYANPRAEAIFGVGPGELLGRSVLSLIDPADLPRVVGNFRQLWNRKLRLAADQFGVARPDGARVVVGAQGVLAQVDGTTTLIAVMQDITDKVRAEEQASEYVAKLERALTGTVTAVSRMMDLRDPYTAGHEQRVGEIAAAIAAEMGQDAHAQQGLRIAGAVHDVGKITVPAEILSRPGRLTPTEFEIVKTHAQQGWEVLKDIDSPWPIAEVAYQHHERMDGSGYPRGLKGEEILLEARILAVADVVESMASHRPYRPTLGVESALEEIEKNAGRLYDAEVAAACLRLFRDKGYALPA